MAAGHKVYKIGIAVVIAAGPNVNAFVWPGVQHINLNNIEARGTHVTISLAPMDNVGNVACLHLNNIKLWLFILKYCYIDVVVYIWVSFLLHFMNTVA